MSQNDCAINRQFKKHLNAPSVSNESCAPLKMGDILSVIKKMKGKGAPGPDNIPPSFLKSLGALAIQELLSILAPLLFHFYINNLASLLNDDAVIALFADDFSILTTARKKEDAEATAQSLVNSILIWNQAWKLNLNTDKSEVCPFSTRSNDSTWKSTVFTGTQKIRVNVTPRLLGVILDRSLTFNAHLKKLTSSLSSSLRIISATAHTSWGWHCSTLKMAFHAVIRSKLDYAASAWQPWMWATNLSCLDRLQNRSLRLITGQLVSTPLETLRLETDVQSYQTCSNRLILKASEKTLRSTDDHPKSVALATNIPQRLQRCCSFRKANKLSTLLPP